MSYRTIITIAALYVLVSSAAVAELPTHFIYRGEPLYLDLDPTQLMIRYQPDLDSADHQAVLNGVGFTVIEEWATGSPGWYVLTHDNALNNATDVDFSINELTALAEIEYVSPVFSRSENNWVAISPDILISLKPEYFDQAEAVLSELAPQMQITDSNFGNMPGAFVLRSGSHNGFEVLDQANELAGDNRVKWAEPDMICFGEIAEPETVDIPELLDGQNSAANSRLIPNDPLFYLQWSHLNTGQFGGVPGIDTDADLTWDITTGSPDIKILVLDDGVQLDHPDLNVLPGADFTYNWGNLGGPVNKCDNHGTSVAGNITAIINNETGCVGIAPDCKVLPARIFIRRIQNPCTMWHTQRTSWSVNALAWGQEQGARVSNLSSSLLESDAIYEQFLQTYNNGMVHFASAGNQAGASIIYPASLEVVNAVSMLKYDGVMYPGCHGPEMAVCAPGVHIVTTDRTGADGSNETDYKYSGGTSHSSPYAAGVAALILSAEPSLTPAEVERRLLYSAVDYGEPGFDEYYGHGVVNAYRALRFTYGDCNGDFEVDSSDVKGLFDYYFYPGAIPAQVMAGDLNTNGQIDLADILALAYLVNLGGGAD
ncbi:MAG: S8 family serine peptidase [Candidatus Zixiibacteriota bacterium]|nr:MAG: S8 family serine peptidase [candidate division Zixibacteria bacterium]